MVSSNLFTGKQNSCLLQQNQNFDFEVCFDTLSSIKNGQDIDDHKLLLKILDHMIYMGQNSIACNLLTLGAPVGEYGPSESWP